MKLRTTALHLFCTKGSSQAVALLPLLSENSRSIWRKIESAQWNSLKTMGTVLACLCNTDTVFLLQIQGRAKSHMFGQTPGREVRTLQASEKTPGTEAERGALLTPVSAHQPKTGTSGPSPTSLLTPTFLHVLQFQQHGMGIDCRGGKGEHTSWGFRHIVKSEKARRSTPAPRLIMTAAAVGPGNQSLWAVLFHPRGRERQFSTEWNHSWKFKCFLDQDLSF